MTLERHRPEKHEFVIARTFAVPREKVWRAFTDPQEMQSWWGPKGSGVIAQKMDLRAGGNYHYGLRSPEGQAMWGKLVYREVTPPERLVFVNSFSDEQGGLTRHPMSPTWPLEMLSTVTFTENNGQSTLTIKWEPIDPTTEELKTFEEGRDGMHKGWTGTLDQLDAYLTKM